MSRGPRGAGVRSAEVTYAGGGGSMPTMIALTVAVLIAATLLAALIPIAPRR